MFEIQATRHQFICELVRCGHPPNMNVDLRGFSLVYAGQTIRNQELASLLRLDSDEFRYSMSYGSIGAVAS